MVGEMLCLLLFIEHEPNRRSLQCELSKRTTLVHAESCMHMNTYHLAVQHFSLFCIPLSSSLIKSCCFIQISEQTASLNHPIYIHTLPSNVSAIFTPSFSPHSAAQSSSDVSSAYFASNIPTLQRTEYTQPPSRTQLR